VSREFEGISYPDLSVGDLDGGDTRFRKELCDFPDPLFSHLRSSFPLMILDKAPHYNHFTGELYRFSGKKQGGKAED
jgi:hypothetical protein